MAIQIPNPGTGNGQTGDNEFVLWSKVKDNFSDATNAASKLVGTEIGQIPLYSISGIGSIGLGGKTTQNAPANFVSFGTTADAYPTGIYQTSNMPVAPNAAPLGGLGIMNHMKFDRNATASTWINTNAYVVRMFIRSSISSTSAGWAEVMHTLNTTVDSNGFIKKASPIVKVYAEKIELNDEANSQSVTFTKSGIGDYTITTVSGLSTDGWYLELPKDLNGNPKIAVTLDEVDGVITLKSYKRVFSMETFTFTPDINEPLDIPDGRWIDLRLNEIPAQETDMSNEV